MNRSPFRVSIYRNVFFLVLALGGSLAAGENETPEVQVSENHSPALVQEFFNNHCLDCHQGADGEGGFDLAALGDDLSDATTVNRWVRIFDRVTSGEMPPPDSGRLDAEEIESFGEVTKRFIVEHQRHQQQELGRVRGRRLTSRQIERSLQDLFLIDIPLANLVPDEPRTRGFWGIAQSQTMSHFHLESHLKMVDAALDETWRRLFDSQPFSIDLPAKKVANKERGQRNREPELIDGNAVVWNSGLIFYGRVQSTRVNESGWYDIEVTASGLKIPQDDSGIWCSVRSGACTSGAPLMFWIDSMKVTHKPETWTFRAYIQEGHLLEIRPSDIRLDRANFQNGQVGVGEGEPQDVPGVAIHRIKMNQVFPSGDRDRIKKRFFGDTAIRLDGNTRTAEFISKDPMMDAKKQIRSLARRAFRDPDVDAQVQPFIDFFESEVRSGSPYDEALRATYRAILSSPRFLYFHEEPGKLDAAAYATRLAFTLTGSHPDYKLTQAAIAGDLDDAEKVIAEVDRMLSGGNRQRFAKDLSTQWLDLYDIDFTEPDPKLHRDFDIIVQNAMVAETEMFLADLIKRNAPITQLVGAQHTYLNGRLAEYYGIAGIDSDRMEKADVSKYPARGGLLAQGAILKVTANGNDTSPVVRGVWVSERILGCEIPPPPENVPAVEPDIRGAKTIRQQLSMHQSEDSCASCHRNIDPPGYALENFDAAGRWRTNYPKFQKKAEPLPIDASFVLADGRPFDDFVDFKTLIASDSESLARNFASQLMVYGTGAEIEFVDREAIDQIVAKTAKNNYGIRDLINAVVTSDLFRQK